MAEIEPTPLESAMHSVWLHANWRFLTLKMTTEEKEAAADAVQRYSDYVSANDDPEFQGPVPDLRWWHAAKPASVNASKPYADTQSAAIMNCGHPIDWLDDDNGCRGCASGRTFCEPCALLISCPDHDPLSAASQTRDRMAGLLHNADPDCVHEIVDGDNASGVKCAKCPGWYCA